MKKLVYLILSFALLLILGCIPRKQSAENKQSTVIQDKSGIRSEFAIPQAGQRDNALTESEAAAGWKLLFDGKSSAGWINAKTGIFPATGWEVKYGMMSVDPASKKDNGGGDIVSAGKYRNFELIVDFMYTKGANSGIKYFVDTEAENGSLSSIGCEYQILDDRNHPDANEGFAGNRKLAGLYDLIAPVNVRDNGYDHWNRAAIVVDGNKVQHWLNGFMTVEYERGNQKWRELVATSKFKPVKGFGEAEEGKILLQDHGDKVSFRNIKIREL
jgi:3-keto-disaccharide hydrolase